MEHSLLERNLPVKKLHQKLVEEEDSKFEMNLFLRLFLLSVSPFIANVFGIVVTVLWLFVSLCSPLFPSLQQWSSVSVTAQTQDLFHLFHVCFSKQ